ncbi:hypothetical protein IscW_ISCW001585 [Ixodes scapularis]|uniref:WD repeat-containing protein 91 n=1 Tax=Ixodes scapularis TaxID=6945 RepID=B7P269_IXOSC|nr:hypothetical protein IscW_ISCW001585 [Ixodes scapularis]|eukprot:XP_002401612.1 hypothetical protein IscW_ISCW001585 [Ixodes scapularis]
MAASQFADDLVRDYLRYRGFFGSLKAFDSEVKADKDKAFRPDRVVEHLSGCVESMDLVGLRDVWAHLDTHIFRRLEQSFTPTVRKLEMALLRMYAVTCISNGRQDKLTEFFDKMAAELHSQQEWKEWFALPFLKGAEDNPNFQVYFTRQWQDMMIISLRNFLSVAWLLTCARSACLPSALPTLLSYDEDMNRMQFLQEENESLKQQVGYGRVHCREAEPVFSGAAGFWSAPGVRERRPGWPRGTHGRLLRHRPVSLRLPHLGPLRQHGGSQVDCQEPKLDGCAKRHYLGAFQGTNLDKINFSTLSTPESHKFQSSTDQFTDVRCRAEDRRMQGTATLAQQMGSFPFLKGECASTPLGRIEDAKASSILMLAVKDILFCMCREAPVSEGRRIFPSLMRTFGNIQTSPITGRKLQGDSKRQTGDEQGSLLVSLPVCVTLATVVSKSSVTALDWVHKHQHLASFSGSAAGAFFGSLNSLIEKQVQQKNSSVMGVYCTLSSVACLACSPVEPAMVSSLHLESTATPPPGKLLLWDLKSKQLQGQLKCGATVNCCAFSRNGQLLLCGTAGGTICLYDVRTYECISSWVSHEGEVFSVQFSDDEATCFSMGAEGKLHQWNVYMTGQRVAEFPLHPDCTGPAGFRPVGKLFSLGADSEHILTCGPNSGIVYKASGGPSALTVGAHKNHVITVDWSLAGDCSTCVTGSINGTICVATLFSQI